jgi:hypothetical protein
MMNPPISNRHCSTQSPSRSDASAPPCPRAAAMHLLHPVILSEAKDLCTFRAIGSSPSRGCSDVSRFSGEYVGEVEPPCHPERSEGPMYFPWVGSSPSRGYSDVSRFSGEHVSEVAPPCHPERSEGPMYFPRSGQFPLRGYSDVWRFSGEHVSEVEPPCHPERSEGPMYFPRDRQFPFERVLRYLTRMGRTR